MRLGLYTFAALAFIGLVAGFVYTVAPGNYALDIAGFHLALPIAVWVILPLVVLLLLTILHMLYHGTRSYFARRKWQRDAKTMQEALYWSLIGEPKPHHYAIAPIREGAALLSSSALEVRELPEGVSAKLAATATWIKQIYNGEYVDLNEKKVDRHMGRENPIRVRNECNRLAKDPEYAEEILRRRDEYAQECVDTALSLVVRNGTFFKLVRYPSLVSFDDVTVLLDRADAGEDVGLTWENLERFIADMDLDCRAYMRIVTSAVKAFDPDTNLAWFQKRAREYNAAEAAYLYLLFRYEMIDKAKEFLEEHEEDEFIAFRAFYTLKKNKYNYKVRDFITADNACA
jgi:hypothetical protein